MDPRDIDIVLGEHFGKTHADKIRRTSAHLKAARQAGLGPDDGIGINVGSDESKGLVVMTFERDTSFLPTTPDGARVIALHLLAHAHNVQPRQGTHMQIAHDLLAGAGMDECERPNVAANIAIGLMEAEASGRLQAPIRMERQREENQLVRLA